MIDPERVPRPTLTRRRYRMLNRRASIRAALSGALVCLTAFAPPSEAQDTTNVAESFLRAYSSGSCELLREFVTTRYHTSILARPELVAQFTSSFAQLHFELGALELRATSYDSVYRTPKYHFFGPTTKEWVSMFFVRDEKSGKIGGHGLFKLQPPPGWSPAPDVRTFRERAMSQVRDLAQAGMFFGAVLITDSTGILVDTAVGLIDGRRPLSTSQRFPIASITKMFTAAAILLLEEQGTLRLTDQIARYLPDYPADIANQVTIRQLLQHTSGLEFDDSPGYRQAAARARSIAELVSAQVAFIDSLNEGRRRNFRPLDRFDYSNEEYDLLGAIVERVSGQRFDRFLSQQVMRPARLKHTSFVGESALAGSSPLRSGTPDPCANTLVLHRGGAAPSPSGGLFSTSADLRRFFVWLNSPRGRSSSLLARMMTDTVTAEAGQTYGFGLQILPSVPQVVGHNGGIAGASSELRYFVREKVLFVALSNRERAAPDLFHFLRRQMR